MLPQRRFQRVEAGARCRVRPAVFFSHTTKLARRSRVRETELYRVRTIREMCQIFSCKYYIHRLMTTLRRKTFASTVCATRMWQMNARKLLNEMKKVMSVVMASARCQNLDLWNLERFTIVFYLYLTVLILDLIDLFSHFFTYVRASFIILFYHTTNVYTFLRFCLLSYSHRFCPWLGTPLNDRNINDTVYFSSDYHRVSRSCAPVTCSRMQSEITRIRKKNCNSLSIILAARVIKYETLVHAYSCKRALLCAAQDKMNVCVMRYYNSWSL